VCERPLAYPKGNLQVWHLKPAGFADGAGDANALMALLTSGDVKKEVVKSEAHASNASRTVMRSTEVKEDEVDEKPKKKARRR
jgi:hypothetical protein